jgi:hypothetical protein
MPWKESSVIEERVFCGGEFARIVATWEEMAIAIHRQDDRRVAEPFLYDLGRQSEPAVGLAVYFARPNAATCTGINPRLMMFASDSILPMPFGKTRSSSPFGHLSFHSRNVLMTRGGAGTVRSPASDFGLPISLKRSRAGELGFPVGRARRLASADRAAQRRER